MDYLGTTRRRSRPRWRRPRCIVRISPYSGSGGNATTWMESENGSDVNSYDLTNSFAYDDGDWTMTAGNNASWGNGSTYQTTSVAFSGGNSSQSSLAETSYSYQENSEWSAATGWAPATGTETDSQNGWSNSTQNSTSSYSIPFSGGGSTGGGGQLPSPSGRGAGGEGGFALAGTSVAYSGGGTESTSGENTSSYSSTSNYTLASDGAWQPVSGTGWSQGNSFSSSSYSGAVG